MSAFGVFLAELHPSFTRKRSKVTATILFILTACALGTSTAVAVAASPACSQLVHTYVDRLVKNRVSADTLKRWHDWGIGHPNWHPALHARRPKYKKVREDVATNEPIACPVLHQPPAGDVALLSPDLDTYLLPVETPDMAPFVYTPASPTEATLVPPGIFPAPPFLGSPGPVGSGTPIVVPPVTTPPNTPTPPVVPEPVPEPGSIVLTLTGLIALVAVALRQRNSLAPSRF